MQIECRNDSMLNDSETKSRRNTARTWDLQSYNAKSKFRLGMLIEAAPRNRH